MDATLRLEQSVAPKTASPAPSSAGDPRVATAAATFGRNAVGLDGTSPADLTMGGRPWTSTVGSTRLPATMEIKAKSIVKGKGEPRAGMQDMVRIKSVFDIYKAVRILVGMVGNVWSASNSTVSCFRQVLPGLAKVTVGNDVYVLPGFLLQDLEPVCLRERPASRSSGNSGCSTGHVISDPSVVEVTCKYSTPYFKHIVLLLKLRWLLRLHSACCELDYKMCSCSNLIRGMQYVVLQQFAEVEADSVFDSKVNRNVGSHINMESVVDDLFDQLQRALGAGWRGFLEYAATCETSRSVHFSRMDLAPAQVVPNSALMTVVDTIFVACFLRSNYRASAADLRGCYEHIEMLGLQVPELPPLRAASNLRSWAKAKTKPTSQDRAKANKKDMEKLAQLDCVLLCAALELRLPEVMASEEEIAEMSMGVTTMLPKSMAGDVAPAPEDFGSTGSLDGGQPAARTILVDRPQVSPTAFAAVVDVLNHHMTFPTGIRERLYSLMLEAYGLTREQIERMAIAVTQNIDGKRLPVSKLLEMEEREKRRLKKYEVTFHKDCSHLLVAPLVAPPLMKMKPARYTEPITVLPRAPMASAFSSTDMTRSLPDFRGFSVRGKPENHFKVPLTTGPLTMDTDLGRLRTTGFFIKMPPLGYT